MVEMHLATGRDRFFPNPYLPIQMNTSKFKGLSKQCNTNPVSISQKTYCPSITKISLLTRFRTIIAIYCGKHMKYITTVGGETTICNCKISLFYCSQEPGQPILYSDALWVGQPKNLGSRLSLGLSQPPIQWISGVFPGAKAAGA
jgi:hypothetical protein